MMPVLDVIIGIGNAEAALAVEGGYPHAARCFVPVPSAGDARASVGTDGEFMGREIPTFWPSFGGSSVGNRDRSR